MRDRIATQLVRRTNPHTHTHTPTHTHTHTRQPTHTHTHLRKQNSNPRNNIMSQISTIQPAKCRTLIAINQRDLHVPHARYFPELRACSITVQRVLRPNRTPVPPPTYAHTPNTCCAQIINNAFRLFPNRLPEMNSKLIRFRPTHPSKSSLPRLSRFVFGILKHPEHWYPAPDSAFALEPDAAPAPRRRHRY